MSKTKTVQAFEDAYDGHPTKPLKEGSVAADLIAFESYGFGKLPRPMASALDDYVFGYVEVAPLLGARRGHTEKALAAAHKEQNIVDAQAVADVIHKGPEALGELAAALDSVDILGKAEAEHELATRAYAAIKSANKGQLVYLGTLVGGEYRDAFIELLDRAWMEFVTVSTDSNTTLGELARLESVSVEARNILGRLLVWAEGVYVGHGFPDKDVHRVREALRSEDWDRVPTVARINQRLADEQAESPEAIAHAEADAEKARIRSEEIAHGAEAARSRQARLRDTTANVEAAKGFDRPAKENEQNSDDALTEELVEATS